MVVASSSIVSLQNLTKSYGRRVALDDVSLEVQPGITGLLGPNGSGKSTMIKCLLGLLRFQSGSASVLGHQLPSGMRAIRDCVGYVPEDDCYLAGLTGIESITFLARLAGLPPVEGLRRSHEVLDFADIAQERYRNVETYSTGMRQKLKFAQAIVHDPQLLILDEPTSGLDPQQRVSLLSKIRTLAEDHGKSVVISTHILNDVKTVCDSVAIMAKGKMRLVDSLANLVKPVRPGLWVQPSVSSNDEGQRLVDQLGSDGVSAELDAQSGAVWCFGVESSDAHRIWTSAKAASVRIARLGSAENSLDAIFLDTIKEAEHASV
ncbi:MAG: ABC transporter ATP-binding protein [Aureliella sp.]